LGLKEVWLSATIDDGDLKRLAGRAAQFVKEGNRVKASIRLKGRQQAYPDRAVNIIKEFIEFAGENIQVEKAPMQEGRNIYTILAPLPNKK
jgi:translation initiation factor IF-3